MVNDLVCLKITTLGKCLAADVAAERSLSRVAPLVSLEVTQLREGLATSWSFAREWLFSGMSADVNIKMRLLVEALVAPITFVNLLTLLRSLFYVALLHY